MEAVTILIIIGFFAILIWLGFYLQYQDDTIDHFRASSYYMVTHKDKCLHEGSYLECYSFIERRTRFIYVPAVYDSNGMKLRNGNVITYRMQLVEKTKEYEKYLLTKSIDGKKFIELSYYLIEAV